MFKSLPFLFFVSILLSTPIIQAQIFSQNTKFKHLSTDNGLSDNSVRAILQDKEGFIWLGTADGLNKYDGYKFTVYRHNPSDTNSIGPGTNIFCIYEDKEGLIWICAEGSLSILDKKNGKFKVYKNDPKNSNSLSNNIVTGIIEDKNGMMWVSTYGGGLNKFDKKTGKFFAYKNSPSNPNSISSDNVENCFEDSEGVLWIATFGGQKGGLNSFDKNSERFSYYPINALNKKEGSCNLLYQIIEDSEGVIWIADGSKGIIAFDKRKKQVVKQFLHDQKNKYSLSNNVAMCLFDDSKGHLWVGTVNGLNILDKKTGKITVFTSDPSDQNGLGDNCITNIYRDNQGLIWICGGGVNIYDEGYNNFIIFKNNAEDEKSLSSNQVISIYEDSLGIIWMGTAARGLTNFDKKTGVFNYFKGEINVAGKKAPIGYVRGIQEIDQRYLWLAIPSSQLVSFDRLSHKYDFLPSTISKKVPNINPSFIFDVLVDSKKTLWAACPSSLFNINFEKKTIVHYKNDPQNAHSISEDYTTNIFEDYDKNVWVGTRSMGLNVFERTSGKFFCFKNDPKNPNSINSDIVNNIYQAPNGVIWIGTNGGGVDALILQNGKNKFTEYYKFYHFTEKDGLPNNVIQKIVPDNIGNLWISTNLGLCKFTPPHYLTAGIANVSPDKNDIAEFKNYDINDGLPSNSFSGAGCKTQDNWLYFGTSDGLLSFLPGTIKNNSHKPPVYLTSFKVFEKEFSLDTPITAKNQIVLSYKQSFFSFEFVALDYAQPSKNQYAYMMEGFDSTWVYVANRRYASYTNLDPGEYVFRVKASNNNGIWNEKGTSIRISITPPFWRTNLFYALCIVLIVTLVYCYIKWRERRLIEEKRILEDQVTKRTKEVVEEKEKVELANSEIIENNKKIEASYHIIEEKNLQITDSINYALYIQKAILPPVSKINGMLTDYFILFKPKDIVSGDFFWFDNKLTTPRINQPAQEVIAIAAVDCTGHGVPGALMSVIGSTILNQTINRAIVNNSGEALSFFNKKVSETLHSIKDGMDMALCFINMEKLELQYAGANNPIYIIRNTAVGQLQIEETKTGVKKRMFINVPVPESIKQATASETFSNRLLEIRADKQAIGADTQEVKVFTNNVIKLEKGDVIYMFTDGYADQFGGDKGKKFKYGKFKELLLEIQNETMNKQQEILNERFEQWRGSLEQVDDILIIGIKI